MDRVWRLLLCPCVLAGYAVGFVWVATRAGFLAGMDRGRIYSRW